MNLDSILSLIVGRPSAQTPVEVARMAIDKSKLTWSVRAQAHARLDRHIARGEQIDDALAQVLKWANSRVEVGS